jgi:octaprenyl-diphosphate synthase
MLAQQPLRSSVSQLDWLASLVDIDLQRVNQLIAQRLNSHVPLIPQVAGHLVLAGGKRLRPMLTLASAALCNYQGDHHIALAASVEVLHTATLMHDDVIDESELRRGKASAFAVWGSKPSILVGDFLFSQAFQLMVSTKSMPVLETLSKATTTIIEGEVYQLSVLHQLELDLQGYLKIIEAKTAVLFASACAVGGIIANKSDAEVRALHDFGYNFGMAFQLSDDVLDYTGNTQTFGKQVGDDFKEGKVTLPFIYAYQDAPDSEKQFWHRTMHGLNQNEHDFLEAIALMRHHDSFKRTLAKAEHYASAAKASLESFPNSQFRQALEGIVDFAVYRAF